MNKPSKRGVRSKMGAGPAASTAWPAFSWKAVPLGEIQGIHPAAAAAGRDMEEVRFSLRGLDRISEGVAALLAAVLPIHLVGGSGAYFLVGGFRTYEICMSAGVHTLEARVAVALNDEEVSLVALATSVLPLLALSASRNRHDLNQLQDSIRRLAACGNGFGGALADLATLCTRRGFALAAGCKRDRIQDLLERPYYS